MGVLKLLYGELLVFTLLVQKICSSLDEFEKSHSNHCKNRDLAISKKLPSNKGAAQLCDGFTQHFIEQTKIYRVTYIETQY